MSHLQGSPSDAHTCRPNIFLPPIFLPHIFLPNIFLPHIFLPNIFLPHIFLPNPLRIFPPQTDRGT
jgi:hypothetical protein